MSYSIPYHTPHKESAVSATPPLQNGIYLAELVKIFIENKKFGETVSVHWRILLPDGLTNKTHWENFIIGSDLPEKREKEIARFNKFWSQINPDFSKESVDPDTDFPHVCRRRMHLKIKNYEGNDGVFRPYVVERTLVSSIAPSPDLIQEAQSVVAPLPFAVQENVVSWSAQGVMPSTSPDDEMPF